MTKSSDSLILPPRYTITRELSPGGMGRAFLCFDHHLERTVAIKFLHDEIDKSRLTDEIHALQKITSKHIVQIYDIIVTDSNKAGIVEEFIDGDDVSSMAGRIAPENYIKLLWQIAAGIAEIHLHGIIHRDIKPGNIKVDKEGIAKIFDFGLARPVGDRAITRGFKGTDGYAAPELYRSGLVKFDASTDVYAFGVMAVFLRRGALPTEFYSFDETDKICFSDEDFSGRLSDDIASSINRCLSAEAAARPKMSAIRDTLGRHMLCRKHRALLVYGDQHWFIDCANASAILDGGRLGRLRIRYNNFDFVGDDILGDIYVNNIRIGNGYTFIGACVITIGTGRDRKFATFDVSHPEVVL